MILQDILVIALRGLRSHKLRSGLTMLGLIIGVAAVILLTAFGQGVAGSVNAAIEPVANSITIVPKVPPIPGAPPAKPLTDTDMKAIAKIPQVAELVPLVTGSTTGAAGQVARAVTASAADAHYLSATVTGTSYNYLSTQRKTLAAGRFFSQNEDRADRHVVVLGPLVAEALYGPDPHAALGQKLRIDHALFEVIGVLRSYGAAGDNTIVMPIGVARSSVFGNGIGGNELSQLSVKATSTADVLPAKAQIIEVLRHNHKVDDPAYDDFQVQDMGTRMTTFNQLIQLIANFVPAIAAVSLLVGAIGVLNIMLVSVTDRTREIGTRKAVGASGFAIMGQFVLEAITMAGLGGLLGVGLGVGMILLTKRLVPLLGTQGFLSSFDPVLSATPIVIAFGISLAIGLLAGSYPAWRAARLEPIDALRFE